MSLRNQGDKEGVQKEEGNHEEGVGHILVLIIAMREHCTSHGPSYRSFLIHEGGFCIK